MSGSHEEYAAYADKQAPVANLLRRKEVNIFI